MQAKRGRGGAFSSKNKGMLKSTSPWNWLSLSQLGTCLGWQGRGDVGGPWSCPGFVTTLFELKAACVCSCIPPPHVQACASACTHIHTWGGTQGFMHTKQVVYHWATFSHPQNIYWAPTMFQGLCYECAGSMTVNMTGLFPPLENLESRERKSVVTKMPSLGT